MVTRAVVLFAGVLMLCACSDSGGGDDAGKSSDSGKSSNSQTALEGLTPDRLCELLPKDAIEETLSVTVTEAKGRQSGRPPILSKTCRYNVEFTLEEVEILPPAVTVHVGQTLDKSVDEILDQGFTDVTDENGAVGKYDKVDGLGAGAGYGNSPLDGGNLDESLLVVVFTAGDERFQFDVTVSPNTPLEQLKPLATDLLDGLSAELK